MPNKHSLIALPLALVLAAGVFAGDPDKSMGAASPDSVEKLKSSLPRTAGFEVDDVRMGADGVSCITYRVSNEQGGKSKAHAVVDGEKVLRSTSRSREFEKAWNGKCARADS